LSADRFFRRARSLLVRQDLLFQLIGLHHQLEFLVFNLLNLFRVALDFVAYRLEFVVLARFILLRLQSRNGVGACPDIEFQLLALHFHLSGFLFQRFQSSRAAGKLSFERFLLLRDRF